MCCLGTPYIANKRRNAILKRFKLLHSSSYSIVIPCIRESIYCIIFSLIHKITMLSFKKLGRSADISSANEKKPTENRLK